jgi:WD40 repeat protein
VAGRRRIGVLLAGDHIDIMGIAFSPDGKTIAVARGDPLNFFPGEVDLWNVPALRPMGEPLTHGSDGFSSVAFSPDGRNLAAGSCVGSVMLWDIASQQLVCEPLTGHTNMVTWTAPNSVDTQLSGFSQLLLVLSRAQIAQS